MNIILIEEIIGSNQIEHPRFPSFIYWWKNCFESPKSSYAILVEIKVSRSFRVNAFEKNRTTTKKFLTWWFWKQGSRNNFLRVGDYSHRSVERAHGLRAPRESFFQKSQTFGLGQTFWAEMFWGICGIFGRTISTHFGTVSSLSMFSIIQPLFLQKNTFISTSKYLFGIGVWIWICAAKN